ncbi:MAG TPA: DUF6607 family protein [Brevundimonas sp.]|jgi:hypothetical protein|uniref:DUF6607 family protein n=1 Tax=Brevundimonas sp. TaxID=1871086 RepID=UPI002DED2D64|nr:DUF6607 family protein [Brevundimonas sp.]
MRALFVAALLATAAVPALAVAQAPAAGSAQHAAYEQDRRAILSQVGDFNVRFDMRETVNFVDGYEPLSPKTSGGHEIVRIVYDTGDRISLQHILVMEHEGQVHVIKHWRQDWVWQPATVLTYAGPNTWVLTPVSDAERAGAWSQTVWQTDDSPRYGGVGKWSHENGMAEWTSAPSWRPLARRDAIRNPVYDRYLGTNRHALTPWGWVHLQDNQKMQSAQGAEGELAVVVHEDVVNSYRRFDGFDPKAGDDYWVSTQGYWKAVRDAWDAAIARGAGIHLQEEPQAGAVTGPELMDLADKVQAGEISEADAIARAQALIAESTTR